MFPGVPDEDLDWVSEVSEASEVSEVSVVSADDEIMAPLTKVQLSPFWPNNAAVCFVRADQEFVIKSVTVQATKYAYLVASLSEDVSMRVADKLTAELSESPYDDLRAHLLKVYTKTDYQKAKLLLELPQLGDSNLSELMNKMLSYLPADVDTSNPGFLFRAIFFGAYASRHQNPPGFQTESMTALADRVDELYSSRVVTSFLVDQETENFVHQPDPVPICTAGRGVADANSVPRFSLPTTQCWYHATYGPSATKCRPPCSYRPPKRETVSGGEETSQSSAANQHSAACSPVPFSALLPQRQLVWAPFFSGHRGGGFHFSPPFRLSPFRPPPHCCQRQRYCFMGLQDPPPPV